MVIDVRVKRSGEGRKRAVRQLPLPVDQSLLRARGLSLLGSCRLSAIQTHLNSGDPPRKYPSRIGVSSHSTKFLLKFTLFTALTSYLNSLIKVKGVRQSVYVKPSQTAEHLINIADRRTDFSQPLWAVATIASYSKLNETQGFLYFGY